jgi:hypothetical protein
MSRHTAKNLLSAILLVAGTALGQIVKQTEMARSPRRVLTGDARFDLLQSFGELRLNDTIPGHSQRYDAEKKSALLAGALSLAVPGVGELYTKSYWRAGGFLLAETGLWVFYAAYTSKGDKQTTLFQNYADDHWSVVRYAQWIQVNLTVLNPDITSGFTGYLIPGTEARPPWEQVDWSKLNTIENQIAQRTGNAFTHLLPHRPEQQYYELIGKYPQFAAGWDDAGGITPARILNSDVSARFLEYSAMRGKANDFYNIATTGAVLLVVNHVLSALDAAWSAAQFNNRLKLEAHLQPTVRSADFVEFVPTARMTISF